MTDLFQPGHHPDADQLSAFAEDALPAYERQHTLAHLATCAYCRGIVSLALPPEPQPQLIPAKSPSRLAAWKFALPTFGLALTALLIFAVAHRHTPAPTSAPQELTRNTPPTQPKATAEPRPPAPKIVIPSAHPNPRLSPATPTPHSSNATLETRSVQNLPLNDRSKTSLQQNATNGAAVAGMARSAAGATQSLPQLAAPAPPPPIPAMVTTVDVTADSPVLETSSSVIASPLRKLPGHRTLASTITRNTQTLALDTTGALFLTNDDGRHWKPVSTQWQGRAVTLTLASYPPTGLVAYTARSAATSSAALITGTVTDPSGAVIPGTIIVLNDSGAHPVLTTITDPTGHYFLDGVAPGTYQLEANSPGFTEIRTVITLSAAQRLPLDITLQIGSASQTVMVTSDSVPLEAQPRMRSLAKAAPKAASTVPTPQLFELTTEAGVHWTSPDGQTWKQN